MSLMYSTYRQFHIFSLFLVLMVIVISCEHGLGLEGFQGLHGMSKGVSLSNGHMYSNPDPKQCTKYGVNNCQIIPLPPAVENLMAVIEGLKIFFNVKPEDVFSYILKTKNYNQEASSAKLIKAFALMSFEEFFDFCIKQSFLKGVTTDEWIELVRKLDIHVPYLDWIAPKIDFRSAFYDEFPWKKVYLSDTNRYNSDQLVLMGYFARAYHVMYVLNTFGSINPFERVLNEQNELNIVIESDLLNVLEKYITPTIPIETVRFVCLDGSQLYEGIIPPKVLEAVKKATNVKVFIENFEITREVTDFLSKFDKIKNLTIYSKNIPDMSLEINQKTGFWNLDIQELVFVKAQKDCFWDLADSCKHGPLVKLATVSSMKHVKKLEINGYDIEKLIVSEMPEMYKLSIIYSEIKSLVVESSPLIDIFSFIGSPPQSVACKRLGSITRLDVECNSKTPEFLNKMYGLRALKIVNAPMENFRIDKLRHLEYLDVIDDRIVSSDFWNNLANSKSLETFYFTSPNYASTLPYSIKYIKSLRKLVIISSKFKCKKSPPPIGFFTRQYNKLDLMITSIVSGGSHFPKQLEILEIHDPELNIGDLLDTIPVSWFEFAKSIHTTFLNKIPCGFAYSRVDYNNVKMRAMRLTKNIIPYEDTRISF